VVGPCTSGVPEFLPWVPSGLEIRVRCSSSRRLSGVGTMHTAVVADERPSGGTQAAPSCRASPTPHRYTLQMRRSTRYLAAWVGLLGLFIAQLTTLAHACPLIEAALAPGEPVVQMASPCEGMRDGPATETAPPPCADHCQYGSNAANTTSVDQPAQAPAAYLVVEAVAAHPLLLTPCVAASLLARTTAPPVFASSSRLRI